MESVLLKFTGLNISQLVALFTAIQSSYDILGSLCYIELGTSIREAGCDFAYICYVKWYAVAFSFMWVSVLMTYPATIAIISETFGQYLIQGLQQSYEIDEALVPVAQKLFGTSLLCMVTLFELFWHTDCYLGMEVGRGLWVGKRGSSLSLQSHKGRRRQPRRTKTGPQVASHNIRLAIRSKRLSSVRIYNGDGLRNGRVSARTAQPCYDMSSLCATFKPSGAQAVAY